MTAARPVTTAASAGRVLVVDDHPANRLLLRDLLEAEGHTVLEAVDGISAVEHTLTHLPDVVLLDVQMPGIDGFEACRRLKAAPETAAIPVLLVTALSAREHRLKGIHAGANDFITKPIDTADLTLRVKNAIQTRRLFTEAESQYQRLRELELLRDNLVHMLVHDLRSPLTGVYAMLQLLQMNREALGPANSALVGDALHLTRDLVEMVSDVLDVSRMEAGQMPLNREAVDLGALVTEVIRTIRSNGVQVVYEPALAVASTHADHKIIARVLANLIDNAVKFTPAGGVVHIVIAGDDHIVSVSVLDSGPGISPTARETIFEKFGQIASANQFRRSSGLGLTFCKLAVEAHGGQIGVDSEVGSGSRFWFNLPRLT